MRRPRHRTRRTAAANGRLRAAFTLIELLVIIIILSMLISMTTPSVLEARKIAKVRESEGYLFKLQGAIGQYRVETDELPPSDPAATPGSRGGRHALAQWLIGYLDKGDDLKDGAGWRKVERGKVYGPYIGPGHPTAGEPPAFVDGFGNEIYYYRYDRSVNRFPEGHNQPPKAGDSPSDRPPSLNEKYLRDQADPNSIKPFYRLDYVLITPGPDRQWETFPAGKRKTDDLANFEFRFAKSTTGP